MSRVYPVEHEWLVQMKLDTGEWGTTLPTDDRERAYARLEIIKTEYPGREYRVVKATTYYTLDHPGPAEQEVPDLPTILSLFEHETGRLSQLAEEIEHMNDSRPADNETDTQ